MTIQDALMGLFGGALIGLASAFLMLTKGRIFGVSGILGGILSGPFDERAWRAAALVGMLTGGLALLLTGYPAFVVEITRSPAAFALAGLLVGFGTRLGSGCTSGHGVCGMSRFSVRSTIATLTFMAAGFITVFVIHHVLGGSV